MGWKEHNKNSHPVNQSLVAIKYVERGATFVYILITQRSTSHGITQHSNIPEIPSTKQTLHS